MVRAGKAVFAALGFVRPAAPGLLVSLNHQPSQRFNAKFILISTIMTSVKYMLAGTHTRITILAQDLDQLATFYEWSLPAVSTQLVSSAED